MIMLMVIQVVDLPDEKLQALHKEAKALYDSYIKVSQFPHFFYPDQKLVNIVICWSKVGADNFIKFDNDIIKEVGAILNQGHKSELGDYFRF